MKISVHQKNSTNLSVGEIGNDYRFFHIDGGHDCEETLSDLRLAADSTDLEDIGAKDVRRIDGTDGAGFKTRIEATLKEIKIDVLLISSETGTFAVYSATKEE